MSSPETDQKTAKTTVEDEDDLDDLDDVITQFKAPPKPSPESLSSQANAPSSQANGVSGPLPAVSPADPALEGLSPELASELAAGMEDLFKELSLAQSNPGDSSHDSNTSHLLNVPELTEEEKKFREVWEKMLVDGMNGTDDGGGISKDFDEIIQKALKGMEIEEGSSKPATDGKATSSSTAPPGEAFQAAIKQTMDKLKTSDNTLNQEASSAADPYASLLDQLGNMKDEDMPAGVEGMLEDMLGALMSKEILYEPLKELKDQFPDYLASHTDLPVDDKKRYESQLRLSTQILDLFEKPGYKDDDPQASTEILKLMNEMQGYGAPPPEIMGPLPGGLGADALANGEGCIIS